MVSRITVDFFNNENSSIKKNFFVDKIKRIENSDNGNPPTTENVFNFCNSVVEEVNCITLQLG